jgi:pyruvate/2-oxoglutarate dehydrogenase complex dihydrolipoamide dehydrogenase (E3) component
VKVTLVNARERLLMQLDTDLSDALRVEMTRRLGVQVVLDAVVREVRTDGRLAGVTLADGRTIDADCVLYCAGREGNTHDLGLAAADVEVNARGFITVDPQFRTTSFNIFAAGDVIGFPALASTAMEHATPSTCATSRRFRRSCPTASGPSPSSPRSDSARTRRTRRASRLKSAKPRSAAIRAARSSATPRDS